MTIYRKVTRQRPKKEVSPFKEVSRDTGAYKSTDLPFSNHCSTFFLKNQFASFSYQLPISFTHGYNTTETWTNWLAPTMWTLARVKTDLDDFLGSKMTPTIWILN